MSEDKQFGCCLGGVLLGVGIGIFKHGLGHNEDYCWGLGIISSVIATTVFLLLAKFTEFVEDTF